MYNFHIKYFSKKGKGKETSRKYDKKQAKVWKGDREKIDQTESVEMMDQNRRKIIMEITNGNRKKMRGRLVKTEKGVGAMDQNRKKEWI